MRDFLTPKTLRESINEQIAELTEKLNNIDKVGEDTYPVGTVIRLTYTTYQTANSEAAEILALVKQFNGRWSSSNSLRSGTWVEWDSIVSFIADTQNEVREVTVLLPTDGKPMI